MENNTFSMKTSHRTGSEASARGRLGRQRGERLVTCCFFFEPLQSQKTMGIRGFQASLCFFLWLRWWVIFLLQNPMVGPIPYKTGMEGYHFTIANICGFLCLKKWPTPIRDSVNWDWMKTAQESFKLENLRIWVCRCACFHTWELPDTYSKIKFQTPNFGSRGSIGLLMLLDPTIYNLYSYHNIPRPEPHWVGLRKPWFLHVFAIFRG